VALGLTSGSDSGNFLDRVQYDARAGRMFRIDRSLQNGEWVSDKVDITSEQPQFAVDFGSIEVGPMAFAVTGPSFHMVPFGHAIPEKPTKDHKLGMRVKLAGKALNGLREFSSSSKCVLSSIDDLHSQFEGAPEAAQGKIPLVKLAGTKAITTKGQMGTSTNYAPSFEIVGWVDRLADMGERTVPAPSASSAPSTPKPAPQEQRQPEMSAGMPF